MYVQYTHVSVPCLIRDTQCCLLAYIRTTILVAAYPYLTGQVIHSIYPKLNPLCPLIWVDEFDLKREFFLAEMGNYTYTSIILPTNQNMPNDIKCVSPFSPFIYQSFWEAMFFTFFSLLDRLRVRRKDNNFIYFNLKNLNWLPARSRITTTMNKISGNWLEINLLNIQIYIC